MPQIPFQYPACAVWNVPDRTKFQRVPTVSSVPALVISGTFGVKTGASWAKDATRNLSRSTAVEVAAPSSAEIRTTTNGLKPARCDVLRTGPSGGPAAGSSCSGDAGQRAA
ncbi:alpha/beta hydrolase [Streptomyces sp. NPDC056401]|uniref:alpha/beta hydrolase n=1 Tax=Streptomyces sp. NPDC056401 TaxID=3345809 RepID=UPI0035DB5978